MISGKSPIKRIGERSGNKGDRSEAAGIRSAGVRGSSMIYVVLLITLMAVLSSGYMAISRYNIQAAINGRKYMEAQITAKTIHSSFCQAVSSGEAESIRKAWEYFEEDCILVREEYDEMVEESDPDAEDQEEDKDGEAEDRWERYLRHALGEKDYVLQGETAESDEAPEIHITVSLKPLDEIAYVHTKVKYNGYEFSLKADIALDQNGRAVIKNRGAGRRRGKEAEIYLDGDGIYRYYGDESLEKSEN